MVREREESEKNDKCAHMHTHTHTYLSSLALLPPPSFPLPPHSFAFQGVSNELPCTLRGLLT